MLTAIIFFLEKYRFYFFSIPALIKFTNKGWIFKAVFLYLGGIVLQQTKGDVIRCFSIILTKPFGFGHGGIAPAAEVGVELRGVFYLNETKSEIVL